MQTKPTKLALLVSAAACATIVTSGAYAQESSGSSARVLEEILVTARKRDESLQQVPLAITALSVEEIERAGITDAQDLALLSPGLSYREGFGRSTGDANNRPSIRGMSSILGSPNASFFVDGVYVNGPIASYSLDNIERVEVIRGPQAAMFGRGTFSGAVNFITRKPGNELGGKVDFTMGEFDHTELKGYITIPVIEDVLAVELNARNYDRGADEGYDNLASDSVEMGAESTKAFGLKAYFTPNEAVDFYLTANWSEDEDGSFAYGLWNGGNSSYDDLITNGQTSHPDTANCFEPTRIIFGFYSTTRTRGYYCGEIKTPDNFYINTAGLNGVERNTFNSSLTANVDINSFTLTSVTGYTTFDYENAFPAVTPYAFDAVAWGGRDDNSYFSQEIRLASNAEQRLRWLIGAYYYKEQSGDGFDALIYPHLPAGNPARPNTPEAVNLDAARYQDDSELTNRAVFGSIDFDVTDTLTLSAEIRRQKEEQNLAGTNASGQPIYDGNPEIEFSSTLPRLSFSWQVFDNINLYGSYAEGNNPGGFNEAYFETRYEAAERSVVVGSRGTYDESDITSYELGLKGQFFDGRMLANVAIFTSDWEKQALTDSDALTNVVGGTQSTVTYIENAGQSSIDGLEVEVQVLPTDWLDLRLSYALAKAEFDDYLDENMRDLLDSNQFYTGSAYGNTFRVDNVDSDGQVAGNTLPQTPEHMASLSATFHAELVDGFDSFLRIDYSYESKRYVQAANLAWIGAAHKVNLRAGIENDTWSFNLWVNNLTDDDTPEVVTRLFDFRDPFYIPSQIHAPHPNYAASGVGRRFSFIRDFTVTAPRTREYGIQLSYKF